MYDQNFYGGGGGWRGGSSEGCFKWGGGGGVIKGSLQKHLKTGWVKAKVIRRGEGVLKVSPPLPPPENFNHTLWMSFLTDNSAQATKIFIVSSNIAVHQILCNNTDTEVPSLCVSQS